MARRYLCRYLRNRERVPDARSVSGLYSTLNFWRLYSSGHNISRMAIPLHAVKFFRRYLYFQGSHCTLVAKHLSPRTGRNGGRCARDGAISDNMPASRGSTLVVPSLYSLPCSHPATILTPNVPLPPLFPPVLISFPFLLHRLLLEALLNFLSATFSPFLLLSRTLLYLLSPHCHQLLHQIPGLLLLSTAARFCRYVGAARGFCAVICDLKGRLEASARGTRNELKGWIGCSTGLYHESFCYGVGRLSEARTRPVKRIPCQPSIAATSSLVSPPPAEEGGTSSRFAAGL
jgi:hypothetical protein